MDLDSVNGIAEVVALTKISLNPTQMKLSNRLTAEKAEELLKMKKIFKDNPGRPLHLSNKADFRKQDIDLVSEDGLEEFVLSIIRGTKRMAKITFNHKENVYNACLFRLDFNGVPHNNPKEPNEFVPEKLRIYAGNNLGRNHVHYYVEGYGPELTWALPLKETKFAPFENNSGIESFLQEMIDVVSDEINLCDKIVYNQNLF